MILQAGSRHVFSPPAFFFLTNGDVCSADVLQGARKPVVVGLLAVPQQPVCQGRPAQSLAI